MLELEMTVETVMMIHYEDEEDLDSTDEAPSAQRKIHRANDRFLARRQGAEFLSKKARSTYVNGSVRRSPSVATFGQPPESTKEQMQLHEHFRHFDQRTGQDGWPAG